MTHLIPFVRRDGKLTPHPDITTAISTKYDAYGGGLWDKHGQHTSLLIIYE